jgi:hypothetical protein
MNDARPQGVVALGRGKICVFGLAINEPAVQYQENE